MGVIEQNQACGDNGSWKRITRLPHDQEHSRDGEGTEKCGEGTEGNVWYFVGNVGVADIVKVEMPIVSDEPAHEGEEELSKGRMYIEEIRPL